MKKNKNLIVFLVGVAIGGSILYFYQPQTYKTTEVHVHSDFLMLIDGVSMDLTAPQYQSGPEQVLHAHAHLHDNNDEVLHRHAEGITLVEFLGSLGYTLTQTCLTTDTALEYCADDTNTLALYINGVAEEVITSYIPQEEDKILLFYGADEPSSYFADITEDACIYSLTCPEKGTPPPESCGLTCEI
jgi:hypothetical protein